MRGLSQLACLFLVSQSKVDFRERCEGRVFHGRYPVRQFRDTVRLPSLQLSECEPNFRIGRIDIDLTRHPDFLFETCPGLLPFGTFEMPFPTKPTHGANHPAAIGSARNWINLRVQILVNGSSE